MIVGAAPPRPCAVAAREGPANAPSESPSASTGTPRTAADRAPNPGPEDRGRVYQLRRRDQEVRTHEAAHLAAGGAYVQGGARYTYVAGPDGKRYAVGGEVNIDTTPVPGEPEATAAKMQTVRRAALAPANPSGQDRSVAARAARAEAQARLEAAGRRDEEGKTGGPDASSAGLRFDRYA